MSVNQPASGAKQCGPYMLNGFFNVLVEKRNPLFVIEFCNLQLFLKGGMYNVHTYLVDGVLCDVVFHIKKKTGGAVFRQNLKVVAHVGGYWVKLAGRTCCIILGRSLDLPEHEGDSKAEAEQVLGQELDLICLQAEPFFIELDCPSE